MFIKPLTQYSDEELMKMLASGNPRALDELYGRYSQKLLRYFFRMLWKDREKAEDCLQDLFMKIIERPESFDAQRKFSTWLYSVAHNMCKNEYRREAVRERAKHEAGFQSVMGVTQREEDNEFRRSLDTAINRLSEADKQLYSLRYEAEVSLEEIARILECPMGTVKSRIFNLKKKLADGVCSLYPEKMRYGTR